MKVGVQLHDPVSLYRLKGPRYPLDKGLIVSQSGNDKCAQIFSLQPIRVKTICNIYQHKVGRRETASKLVSCDVFLAVAMKIAVFWM